NLPILSFVLLRGRCRHCRVPIATRYVVVEASMAVIVLMLLDAFFIGQVRSGVCSNGGRFGLTDDQQDVLTIAFDRGYYAIPRETTLSELADDLDASHQALSERMRRAHRNVVKNTVIIGEEGSKNPNEGG
ncbi:MAG: prepilin peptidase, partial [Euryarchaeota archaeon]|nr:prepilin peptidase [Euryarchaeota archaeon]